MLGDCSMEDIQDLFKETIAEFMEIGLDAELDGELGMDIAKKRTGRLWAHAQLAVCFDGRMRD